MSDFQSRWQQCAARARQEKAAAEAAPAGLATRVWARWRAEAEARLGPGARAPSPWLALSWRALVLATIALAACAALDYYTASPGSSFAPHLEDVVTNVWETL